MSGRIAFIVEGTKREHKIFDKIKKDFPVANIDIIELTMGNNIYNLYKQLKKDDFFTDVIEVIKEINLSNQEKLKGLSARDFQEVYMFFDFDLQEIYHREFWNKQQAYNIVNELLEKFDNETELGKLYISYPMVESFFDTNVKGCIPSILRCRYPTDHKSLKSYKKIVSKANSKLMDIDKYDKNDWSRVCSVFILRCLCLFDEYEERSLRMYKNYQITPLKVFTRIIDEMSFDDEMFILSAIPEFILDYYKVEELEQYIKYS